MGAWFDRRLGFTPVVQKVRHHLRELLPKHVGWLWTLGFTAAFLFVVQIVTGILLMLYYKPTADAAYESVRRIGEEIPAGWLVRGLHVWGSHFIVGVLILHALRVFLYGGYKKPRELTWIFGVLLLMIALGFGLTGYLLPWTQLSYWATTVVTEGAGALPGIGGASLELVRGSEQVSEATLGRFFVAHVILLPVALVILISLHLYLVARLRLAPIEDVRTEEEQGYERLVAGGRPYHVHLTKEVTVALVAVGLLATCAILFPAHLGERADPLSTPEGIKPDWYFLPIYQVQKYFPADMGFLSGKTAGVLFVGLCSILFLLLPFIDRSPERDPHRRRWMIRIGMAVMLAVILIGVLGFLSDRRIEVFGKAFQFDPYGVPHAVQKVEGPPDGH
ncbi:MAG: cytochrome bc complex cytochrome b subunit [Planctomycetota bacterium]|nr:cytochrome bc complex cytochrome b subunit [Planctomycetota bacterium]